MKLKKSNSQKKEWAQLKKISRLMKKLFLMEDKILKKYKNE